MIAIVELMWSPVELVSWFIRRFVWTGVRHDPGMRHGLIVLRILEGLSAGVKRAIGRAKRPIVVIFGMVRVTMVSVLRFCRKCLKMVKLVARLMSSKDIITRE